MSRAEEAREEGAIVHTATIVGFHVYRLSQGYRPETGGTRQTPGLPDLHLIHTRDQVQLWWEVKTAETLAQHHDLAMWLHPESRWPKWKVRDWRHARGQADFRDRARRAGGRCGIGPHAAFLNELVSLGYATNDPRTGILLKPHR